MNKLLWHLELPGVEGLVVRDVALCLGDGDDHVVPLLAVYLLRRDGPLEMVLLEERERGNSCLQQAKDFSRLSFFIWRHHLIYKPVDKLFPIISLHYKDMHRQRSVLVCDGTGIKVSEIDLVSEK